MELNICHLYPELLNMYGDVGNIMILKYRARMRGITVNIHAHGIGDKPDRNNMDIVFLGGGQDFEMGIAAQDIKSSKTQIIKEYIEDGGVFLAVCGGYQMLGEYYETPNKEKIEGLSILPLHTIGGEKRLTGNVLVEIDGDLCAGFENHAGRTYTSLPPLGKVLHGFGNNGEDKTEGARYKNTFCTYLHGPFLSKNPRMADLLLKTALDRKYGDVTLQPLDDIFENAALESVVNRFS